MDQIVYFQCLFSYFKINVDMNTNVIEYKCGADVIEIRV
jgi:hypothetical protein